MTQARITFNGQPYDSPDAMPPDVRRAYEEVLRKAGPSLASGLSGGGTQVFSGHAGPLGAGVVVNRVITVNDHTYGSIDDLPPDVRQLYEEALKGTAPPAGAVRPETSLHLSVSMKGPRVAALGEPSRPAAPAPIPIESSTEATLRSLPGSLAILAVIGLILWFLLGR